MGNNTSTSSTQNNQKEHFQVPKSQQKENIDRFYLTFPANVEL